MTYNNFYHNIIQDSAKIKLCNKSAMEIFTGKAFLIPDEVWENIKASDVMGAGVQDFDTHLTIFLNTDYTPKNKKDS